MTHSRPKSSWERRAEVAERRAEALRAAVGRILSGTGTRGLHWIAVQLRYALINDNALLGEPPSTDAVARAEGRVTGQPPRDP